ncbi:hypothetical protein GCM10020219_054470 [Nonomuraea dietziae]
MYKNYELYNEHTDRIIYKGGYETTGTRGDSSFKRIKFRKNMNVVILVYGIALRHRKLLAFVSQKLKSSIRKQDLNYKLK